MILYFTVSNFRSIRSELTLSMSAGRFKSSLSNRGFSTGFSQMPCVLRAAAIYGANGSGKSNLVRALDFFQDCVLESFVDESGDKLRTVRPFKYGEQEKISTFEVAFIADNIMYTYGFSTDGEVIEEEWLHVKTPEGRVREAFSRARSESEYEWHFSPFFKSKRAVKTWIESTRPNALLLSTAIHLNSEELRQVHRWITYTLRVIVTSDSIGSMVTSERLIDPDGRKELISLLRMTDSTINDFDVEKFDIDLNEELKILSEQFRSELIESLKGKHNYNVTVEHLNSNGDKMKIPLSEESDGTKVIYHYAAPFVESIRNNFVVVVDELDRSLHSLLLRNLVDMFVNPKNMASRSQLIFSTHDSSLLASDLLARDQIWFVENPGGAGTELIPLADYKPRKGEAIQRSYLAGRYGGVPLARQRLLDLGDAE